ncbi:MAG: carbohydrate-binding family 9-like protein [Calditrichaeota bacterium]|nr:carbohydrate-binding family 9-like protein [Calditrichota bacterium]
MRKMSILAVTGLLLLSACARPKPETRLFPTPQIPFHPKTYVCYQTPVPVQIDGRLDDPAWKKAVWTDDFVDIRGKAAPKPRFRTRVKMLWDKRYFYVAAELSEPDVWATLTQHDAVIYHDNDFEVFIDPDGDTHDYYEFEINALNTGWDLLLTRPYRDGGDAVNDWDIHGLKSAVQVNGTLNHPGDVDRGWTVELAFPWEALAECAHKPAPPRDGNQWRINFSRVEWRVQVQNGTYEKQCDPRTGKPLPEDNWVWSPQGLINMHYPEMWGFVQFSKKAVGMGQEDFQPKEIDSVKWALRKVYYAEQTAYLNQKHFVKAIPARWAPKGFPLTIVSGTDFFVATIQSRDGVLWHIREDGLVWKGKE